MYIYNESMDPEDSEYIHEGGDTVSLFLTSANGQRKSVMKITLTGMTETELTAMKHTFDLAFANALASVKDRDQRAMNALAGDGQVGFNRLFRDAGSVIIREGHDYPAEPKILEREWHGLDGKEFERNPLAVLLQSRIASSRAPQNDSEEIEDNEF